MSTQEMGRVHHALRQATALAHQALDHHPLMRRLTGRGLTRAQYAGSLVAMYAPHARLERMVHGSRHHAGSGLGLSARLELLEADLLELGCAIPKVSQVGADASDGRAAWWGRVYVLEGSRLGGAIIARCIRSSLGEAAPLRFFAAGTEVGDRSALLAAIERELEADADLDRAAASARAVFADYKAALDAFDDGPRAIELG